jgi:predicted MFS family arabinose efflux permease
MNFFDRQIIAAVTEPIRKEWLLSDTAMGWLGTAFTLIYATVGVPLGRLSDRWTRTKLLSLGVTVWSLLTAASGLAWNYWSLFVLRLGVGVGEASCAPAGNSLIGDLYPATKRARAIAVFMLGLPVGIFLSNRLSGMIAFAYGWRATFFFACIPGLILAALALLVREPRRGTTETHPIAETQSEGSPYLRVLSIPTMWWIIISGALHNFNAYAVNSFMPAFLSRYHDLDLREATRISAYVLGAVGVIGLLGGGWAADRIRKSWPNGRMLLAAAALLVSTPCVYFALERPKGELTGFVALMGVGWMLIYVYYVTVYSAIQDVVEPGLRGTAMALYFFAMYVLGGSFGSSITGMLSDHYARQAMAASGSAVMAEPFRAAGLHSAMYVIPLLSLVLSGVLFAASRTIGADMERLQRWMRESAAGLTPPKAMAAEES